MRCFQRTLIAVRRLVSASDEIASAAMNPQGRAVKDIVDEAEGKIFRINEEGNKSGQGLDRKSVV